MKEKSKGKITDSPGADRLKNRFSPSEKPKQAASSVRFEFDGASYQIKWQFLGEFNLTTQAELNEIGEAIQVARYYLNSFSRVFHGYSAS